MLKKNRLIAIILPLLCFAAKNNFAQPSWTFKLFDSTKKPEKYEERKLGSEKTADKKFTTIRRFTQNNITHYNFYFNANNKLNGVIEKAKISQKDDYAQLLSFYPYTLENTAAQSQELDSVIYKCTAGILLHDLRSDWVDNLYLLIGKSYYLSKKLDSAAMTFQFINYNLFPRKKKEDDDRIVGTNDLAAGRNISIANKEKRSLLQKVLTLPPSRNDALIWLARTLTELDEIGEAAGLINILQNDVNLPKRLQNDLDEVNAYWFYKQGVYDSAATHLEKALSNADTKQDKSRWEYLLAQLYEQSKNYDKASAYYAKASKHTIDPIMDIYARLNDAKMMKTNGNGKELDRAADNLAHMGRKDKFEAYRDIIYFSAGQITLQKPDTATAIEYFNKSLKYNETNTTYKNKTFIQLGDIAYKRKQYRQAFSYYDSLQSGDTALAAKMEEARVRREALAKIVEKLNIIEREDSLQRIAAMPLNEREAFVKKLLRKLRKEKGLKDIDNNDGNNSGPVTFNNNKNEPVDLFSSNSKGEWYFYNASLKSRGASEFKTKWGERSNTDNWRRKAAGGSRPVGVLNSNPDINGKDEKKEKKDGTAPAAEELTIENLLAGLPLTPEKLGNSHDMISGNLLLLAKVYQDDLQDYEMAAATYEEYLQRYPDRLIDGEIYLGLFYCYTKLADKAKADYYKNLLNTKFKDTKFSKMANNPASLNPKTKNPAATKKYEDIYNLFIEGKFDEALIQKKMADSIYGSNYWTPQLLYIEAVYNVKQKNDSAAIEILNQLITLYPNSPLKAKAENLKDVLGRRKEIEQYLTNLQITRMEEEKILMPDDTKVVTAPINKPAITTPAVINKPSVPKVVPDTVKKTVSSGSFVLKPLTTHFVVMVLDKVDGVYVNESKNAFDRYNRTKFYSTPITITKDAIDADRKILIFSQFLIADEALDYYDKIKRAAPSEISWLPAAKYSFIIINDENLQLLKANGKLDEYKKLLNTQYPGRF